MSSHEQLVTLARFMYSAQAETARITLQGEGIQCFLADEAQGGLTGIGIIPIRLQVFPADHAAAKEILIREKLYEFEE